MTEASADASQLGEPLAEGREIEHRLCLEEVRARVDLLDGLLEIGGHRLGERRCGGADEVLGRLLYLIA